MWLHVYIVLYQLYIYNIYIIYNNIYDNIYLYM